MITFHNDHLVSPEFCKLIYDTVPEEYHIPVIFVPHTKDYRVRGSCNNVSIRLNLQGIFYEGFPTEFNLWKRLLFVIYHEFGHKATKGLTNYISREEYIERGRGYLYTEQLADSWANIKLMELADKDKRLCQPNRFGPYFDGRIAKWRIRGNEHGGYNVWSTNHYRCHICGGQLSASQVASELGVVCYPKSTLTGHRYIANDTRRISKVAIDLAYVYTDHANRKYLYFAWGDIFEIRRRVARYKAIHGPIPSEIEYNNECNRINSEQTPYSGASFDSDLLDSDIPF